MLFRLMFMLMDKAGEGDAGGGSKPDPAAEPNKEKPPGDEGGKPGNVVLTQDQFDKMMARIEGGGKADGDKDLFSKSQQNQAEKDRSSTDSKRLESAIRFTMGAKEWVKQNESMLPKDIAGILEAADKETYDSTVQKDGAIKSGIIQAFFNVQENLDLLTTTQKSTIEDFLKLTKNGKEEKAQAIYDSVFEPTFEMKKRISKAQQLNRNGERSGDDVEQAYKQKLMNGSKNHYMGEKSK